MANWTHDLDLHYISGCICVRLSNLTAKRTVLFIQTQGVQIDMSKVYSLRTQQKPSTRVVAGAHVSVVFFFVVMFLRLCFFSDVFLRWCVFVGVFFVVVFLSRCFCLLWCFCGGMFSWSRFFVLLCFSGSLSSCKLPITCSNRIDTAAPQLRPKEAFDTLKSMA